MSRFQASFYHFLISTVVGLVLLALCWLVWYPAPMLMAIGGHEIFLLVLGVDVVLGPLLTLVVFRSGKSSLRFDLSVIAIMQVCALLYGVSVLLEARPVYVAALGDEFQVVQATEVTEGSLVKAKAVLPWWGPLWVGTKAPVDRYDIDAVNDLKMVGAGRGHLPQLHIPYETMSADVLQHALPIQVLKKAHPEQAEAIDKWLADYGYEANSVKFQPIRISASVFSLMLDANTGRVIGIAPFAS